MQQVDLGQSQEICHYLDHRAPRMVSAERNHGWIVQPWPWYNPAMVVAIPWFHQLFSGLIIQVLLQSLGLTSWYHSGA